METEEHKKVKAMSGGNKRKLSLALSIMGKSKIIFLDEPTSGLDPQSRRFVWDLIKDLKNEGKCVVLTTHFLDEAEHLGDRLVIMSKGQLYAVGTPNYIKKEFGIGYYLSISPEYESPDKKELADVKEQIDSIVNKFILGAKRDEETRDTFKYLLPFNKIKEFPALFEELENIEGIKLSLEMNSLEDAFINMGLKEEIEPPKKSFGLMLRNLEGPDAEEK